MDIRTSQPPHLKKPIKAFCIGFLVYSILVVAAFDLTSSWMPQANEWRSYLAALPGVALCGLFVLLYSYMRHNDELAREIATTSLAASCVFGLSTLVVSMSRAEIGGYPEFEGATIVVVMALSFVVLLGVSVMETSMKNRVRELRKNRSWTQEQFGDLLEVSRQTINSIENGRFDPSLTLALKMSELLEESVEGIFVLRES